MSCSRACPLCAQLRAATLSIVGDRGLEALTLEGLAGDTGLPVDEVRAHYPTATSCLHAAYEESALRVRNIFADAFSVESGYRHALQVACHALLDRMAAHPAEARFLFVEVPRGDHGLLRLRVASRMRLVQLFVAEARRRHEDLGIPELQLELLIGAAFQAICNAVESGRIAELPELEPELVSRAYVFEPAMV